MSAIIGALVFSPDNFEVTDGYLTTMRDTMTHRGPDGAGLWIADDRRVGLGHRRLAVADPSQSAVQPMASLDGRYRVSFNGQIYNHADVRSELDQLGPQSWSSQASQCEVVLRAFEQWGIDCLEKFNGCFAIALWDSVARELWLVRDRAGIKPLYYSIHDGRITFASEIKALLEDPDQTRAVNEDALFHYLSFLATPAPLTMFDGIYKVPCATWIKVSRDGQTESRRYWDPLDGKVSLAGLSDDEICDRVLRDLTRSVRLRADGGGSVGAFLSGGLDSGINATLLAKVVQPPLKTFTYSYEYESDDYRKEATTAGRMADFLGYKNFVAYLGIDDVLEALPKVAKLQDEPISDPHCISFFQASQTARDHGVLACQNTIGADELFMGKPHWPVWIRLARMNAWPVPIFLKRVVLLCLRMIGRGDTFMYDRLRRVTEGEQLFWNGVEMFPDAGKKYLLSERLRKKFAGRTSFEAVKSVREAFERRSPPDAYLSWMTYMDLHLHTPEHQLMRSEKASMGRSHESRFPFLDHEFVELVMSIPEETHTGPGTLKPILEKIARQILPYELVEREQADTGFPYQWMYGPIGDFTRQELDKFCQATDFFDRQRVLELVDQMQSGQDKHAARQCWCLLVFATWWNQYFGPGSDAS